MTITKYGQSCVVIDLLDKVLLIDPGSYAESHGKLTAEGLQQLDAILITHEHNDHVSAPFLRTFVERFHPLILTNASVQAMLQKEDIAAEVLEPEESVQIGEVTITGVAQRHGDLPSGAPNPEDLGFLINNSVYHPGDSRVMDSTPKADILCCPIAGPEMTFDTARALIEKVEPYLVIPIHYDNQEGFPCDPDRFAASVADLMTEIRLAPEGEAIQL